MKLHASGEDYLETILVLQKKLGMVRSVDVARHMEVSKPSVCHAVATLREGGFLTMDSDYFLHLTDVGREVAEQIYEKHRFFTDRLIEAGVLLESLRVLKKGGVFALNDDMKPKLYGDMDAFAQKLREMGYQDVRLIDTAEEAFGSHRRAAMMMLGSSRLLVGRK